MFYVRVTFVCVCVCVCLCVRHTADFPECVPRLQVAPAAAPAECRVCVRARVCGIPWPQVAMTAAHVENR